MNRASSAQLFFSFVPRPAKGPSPRRTCSPRNARVNLLSKKEVNPAQGYLPWEREVDDYARLRLQRRIAAHLRGDLNLLVTDNRTSMISIRRGRHRYEVRLHHMFLEAEPQIVRALARYIATNDATSSERISEYIDRHQDKIRLSLPRKPKEVALSTKGKFFDLLEIFNTLNARYFGGKVDAQITWGRQIPGKPRRRTSMKMGSYSVEDRLIRIHRSLDRSFVPRFFLESIVFHEMLHQIHDIPVFNGRRSYHTRAFTAHEGRFEFYDAARQWERDHLSQLLYF